MSVTVACRACGCPVPLPDGSDPALTECPQCREKKLAGSRPVLTLDEPPVPARREPFHPSDEQPPSADSSPPSWLVAIAGLFALALWVGPIAVSRVAGLNFGLGMLVGGLLAAAVLAANAMIVFGTRLSIGAKIGVMAGVASAMLAMFFVGAYLAGTNQTEELAEGSPTPKPPLPPPPFEPLPQPIEPPPRHPPSHIDLAYSEGMSRLDDGRAAVTALALAPLDNSVVIGYADGSTAIWSLDQPTFDPPQAGPKGDGAVRRIQFDNTGQLAYLTCDNGLIAAPLLMPPATPLKIPGDRVVVLTAAESDQFAAVRGQSLHIRYVPIELVKKPPPVKGAARFSLCPPRMEVVPNGRRPQYGLPHPDPTFLAWHPAGKLLWGMPGGSVIAWPGGPKVEVLPHEHKGSVRVWTVSGWTFATGDDKGGIGYWPDKATTPVMYWNGTAPITQLALASWGLDVAVADEAGGLSVWDMGQGRRVFEIKRPAPIEVMSYGPSDDLLLIADGKGVEVWWIPELAKSGVNVSEPMPMEPKPPAPKPKPKPKAPPKPQPKPKAKG